MSQLAFAFYQIAEVYKSIPQEVKWIMDNCPLDPHTNFIVLDTSQHGRIIVALALLGVTPVA